MREIGVTCSGQRGADDSKTLSQAKFQIGDYLAINVTHSNSRGGGKESRDDRGGGGRDRDDDRRRDRDNIRDDRRRDRRDRPY
jgi:hypothetical protein